MRSRNKAQRNYLRTHIAQAAAKLIVESGIQDYAVAKRKAAAKLQMSDLGQLPGNEEIEQELIIYQRLFRGERHAQRLHVLRHAALHAMHFLARFRPYLVGPILRGTADEYSKVNLHLFAEPSEEVGLFLLERGIPHELSDRRLRVSTEAFKAYPAYTFMAKDVPVELVVFAHRERKHPPLCPIDGKQMRRASAAAVEALLSRDPVNE